MPLTNQVAIYKPPGSYATSRVPTGYHLKFLQDFSRAHMQNEGMVIVTEQASGNVTKFSLVLLNVIELIGSMDSTSGVHLQCDVDVIIPILGGIRIASIGGDLEDGITAQVGVWGVATGSLTFKIDSGYVKMKASLVTPVKKFDQWFSLFPVPTSN